jgi:hypothetical protein
MAVAGACARLEAARSVRRGAAKDDGQIAQTLKRKGRPRLNRPLNQETHCRRSFCLVFSIKLARDGRGGVQSGNIGLNLLTSPSP